MDYLTHSLAPIAIVMYDSRMSNGCGGLNALLHGVVFGPSVKEEIRTDRRIGRTIKISPTLLKSVRIKTPNSTACRAEHCTSPDKSYGRTDGHTDEPTGHNHTPSTLPPAELKQNVIYAISADTGFISDFFFFLGGGGRDTVRS